MTIAASKALDVTTLAKVELSVSQCDLVLPRFPNFVETKMIVGRFVCFPVRPVWIGLQAWLIFLVTSVQAAELSRFELQKNAGEIPQITRNDLDEIREKRAGLRDQTILRSH